jgi:hypothetical protein
MPSARGTAWPVSFGVQARTSSGRCGERRAWTTIWNVQMIASQAAQTSTIRTTSGAGRNGSRGSRGIAGNLRRDDPDSPTSGNCVALTRTPPQTASWNEPKKARTTAASILPGSEPTNSVYMSSPATKNSHMDAVFESVTSAMLEIVELSPLLAEASFRTSGYAIVGLRVGDRIGN